MCAVLHDRLKRENSGVFIVPEFLHILDVILINQNIINWRNKAKVGFFFARSLIKLKQIQKNEKTFLPSGGDFHLITK